MFISTNTRRPAVTVAINFGDISTRDVDGYIHDAVNIANGRNYGVLRNLTTANDLKAEINRLVAKGRSTVKDAKDWEKRFPADIKSAKDLIVLYNIERIKNRAHAKWGTTLYIYVLPRKLVKKHEQVYNRDSKNHSFVATLDPKVEVPTYGNGDAKVYKFGNEIVRTYREATYRKNRTGEVFEAIDVVVTADGRYFPASSEIKEFKAVNLFADGLYFDKAFTKAQKLFGKEVYKVSVEGIPRAVTFNTDVTKFKHGLYRVKSQKEELILVVDEIKDAFEEISKKFHLIAEKDPRIVKLSKKNPIKDNV